MDDWTHSLISGTFPFSNGILMFSGTGITSTTTTGSMTSWVRLPSFLIYFILKGLRIESLKLKCLSPFLPKEKVGRASKDRRKEDFPPSCLVAEAWPLARTVPT